MEMAGKLLAWLVLEGIVGTKNLHYKHIGLFSDNMAAVSWTQMGTAKNSASAGCLHRVLDFRKRVARASQLVATHVAGDLNVIGGIPYRSFGYYKQWHCTDDSEFWSLINSRFPLPHHCSWKGLLPSFVLIYRSDFRVGEKGISDGRVEATS